VFDEAGLAAAGGALDQQRQALVEGVLEERDLASLLRVEGKTAGSAAARVAATWRALLNSIIGSRLDSLRFGCVASVHRSGATGGHRAGGGAVAFHRRRRSWSGRRSRPIRKPTPPAMRSQ
jgi:hypothetical protein